MYFLMCLFLFLVYPRKTCRNDVINWKELIWLVDRLLLALLKTAYGLTNSLSKNSDLTVQIQCVNLSKPPASNVTTVFGKKNLQFACVWVSFNARLLGALLSSGDSFTVRLIHCASHWLCVSFCVRLFSWYCNPRNLRKQVFFVEINPSILNLMI